MGVFSKSLAFFWISLCVQIAQPMKQDELSVKIKELHTSLNKLKTKLDALNKGLITVKNRLLGIEDEEKIAIPDEVVKAVVAIREVVADPSKILNDRNSGVDAAFQKAKDLVKEIQESKAEITHEQREVSLEFIYQVKIEFDEKYKDFRTVGDATSGEYIDFYGVVSTVIDKGINLSAFEKIKDKFLRVNTQQLKSKNGYNTIQKVAEFIQQLINENMVSPEDVLSGTLAVGGGGYNGFWGLRTQSLILLYVLLVNNFVSNDVFVTYLINCLLGYSGQPPAGYGEDDFKKLGKSLAKKVAENVRFMSPEIKDLVVKMLLEYSQKIHGSMKNEEVTTTISGKTCKFKYYSEGLQFDKTGVEIKADLLRYILAFDLENAIVSLPIKEKIILPPPTDPLVEEKVEEKVEADLPISPEPVILPPQPEKIKILQEIVKVIKNVEKEPKKGMHFPVEKFKEIVEQMQKAEKTDSLLSQGIIGDIRVLGYFVLFMKQGHQYWMSSSFKDSYKEMLGLSTQILRLIEKSKATIEALRFEPDHLLTFVCFFNFLSHVPSGDFDLDASVNRINQDDLPAVDFPVVKTSTGENMLEKLFNWFDPEKRSAVEALFESFSSISKYQQFKKTLEMMKAGVAKE